MKKLEFDAVKWNFVLLKEICLFYRNFKQLIM